MFSVGCLQHPQVGGQGMDDRRFDAIARFLEAIQTRRYTLIGAIAALLAL